MGYSRSIRGVFTGYSYVSVMYRLCIGYVSVMYRLPIGTDTEVGGGNLDERQFISPCPAGRNLNKSFCHAFTLLNNLGQFSCQLSSIQG